VRHGRRLRVVWRDAPTAEWKSRAKSPRRSRGTTRRDISLGIKTPRMSSLLAADPCNGIRDHSIAPRSPWQNAYIERLIGSIRRECLDHMIVFDEAHLHRILRGYAPMRVLKKKLLAKGITPVNFAGVKATFYRRADVDPVVPSI
jgi:transposase InsO family protein